MKLSNTTVTMVFQGAFVENGIYDVVLGNKKARISIVIQRDDQISKEIKSRLVYVGKAAYEPFYQGIVSASRVLIEFEHDLNKEYIHISAEEIALKIKEHCIDFLNRLINVVRFVTKKYWIRPVSSSEIIYFSLTELSDKYTMNNPAILCISSDPLTNELAIFEESIRKKDILSMLKMDAPIARHEILLLEALNYYSTNQYDQAIILINIALEEYVRYFIFIKLTCDLGYSKDNADRKISKIFAQRRKQGKSGLHKVLSVDLKEIIGKSLEDDKEVWTCFNRLRIVRKNIVHPITMRVLKTHAADCIFTVHKIINWTKSATL